MLSFLIGKETMRFTKRELELFERAEKLGFSNQELDLIKFRKYSFDYQKTVFSLIKKCSDDRKDKLIQKLEFLQKHYNPFLWASFLSFSILEHLQELSLNEVKQCALIHFPQHTGKEQQLRIYVLVCLICKKASCSTIRAVTSILFESENFRVNALKCFNILQDLDFPSIVPQLNQEENRNRILDLLLLALEQEILPGSFLFRRLINSWMSPSAAIQIMTGELDYESYNPIIWSYLPLAQIFDKDFPIIQSQVYQRDSIDPKLVAAYRQFSDYDLTLSHEIASMILTLTSTDYLKATFLYFNQLYIPLDDNEEARGSNLQQRIQYLFFDERHVYEVLPKGKLILLSLKRLKVHFRQHPYIKEFFETYFREISKIVPHLQKRFHEFLSDEIFLPPISINECLNTDTISELLQSKWKFDGVLLDRLENQSFNLAYLIYKALPKIRPEDRFLFLQCDESDLAFLHEFEQGFDRSIILERFLVHLIMKFSKLPKHKIFDVKRLVHEKKKNLPLQIANQRMLNEAFKN